MPMPFSLLQTMAESGEQDLAFNGRWVLSFIISYEEAPCRSRRIS